MTDVLTLAASLASANPEERQVAAASSDRRLASLAREALGRIQG